MALQSIIDINVDFYDKKYTLINAKQLDKNSRFLSVTCYNHGKLYPINAGEHSAYIRYKKSDNHSVFNFCEINRYGKILVELTEQMLVSDGICTADLVIVNKGNADVDTETGEIVAIDNASILSTMPLHIDVVGNAILNSEIESSYEYDGLNDLLERAEADYEEVILTSKSYAIGGTGIRSGEDTDNARYYASQASGSASAASTSALNAAYSEELAEDHMQDALSYKNDAYTYMTNANTYMENAYVSEQNAEVSEINAASSEANAASSEANAKTSETNALSYKEIIESINDSVVGSINTLASNGNIGSFIFINAITFEELIALSDDKKATGYVYCVTDDFVTDDSFVNGAGLSYTAGTNIYHIIDENGIGKWDCLGGAASTAATVDEVKEYLGIE